MKRNFRTLFVAACLIVTTIVASPSIGSTIKLVYASDLKQLNQSADSTDEPQLLGDSVTQPSANTPTDAPTDVATLQPTDLPTLQPTDLPTDVSTEVATDTPVSADATQDPTATETPTDAEVTPTVTPEATQLLEATLAAEETLAPEVTEMPTVIAPEFKVATTCDQTGVTISISNIGADMGGPSSFTLTLDDAANSTAPSLPANLASGSFPTEFTLRAGESTNIQAGFGQPKMVLSGVLYTPDAPCLPPTPPVLNVNAICSFEKGVTFTITNSGGAMPVEQGFTIALNDGSSITNTFKLGTSESVSFDAGYGQPTLNSGDIVSTTETPCNAPTAINGSVWNDADGNGVRDAVETGLAGVKVNLIDANGTVKTVMTTVDGNYNFANLHVGSYTIKVDSSTLSPDYVLSYPSDNTVAITATGENNVVNFGYIAHPTASVTGTVWLETSNYGVRDEGETGIAGVIVQLVDLNGTVVAVAPVDATTGTYIFTAVLSGSYTVRLDQTTLFNPNGVTYNSDSKLDYETPIVLTTGQALANIDFGLVGTY